MRQASKRVPDSAECSTMLSPSGVQVSTRNPPNENSPSAGRALG